MPMKKVFVSAVLIFSSSFGQQFTDLTGDYLGQIPPGETPVVFAPGIVSTVYMEHRAPAFSMGKLDREPPDPAAFSAQDGPACRR